MLAQVQAVIDALAERLQRSVVVNDPDVRFLCASPHYGDEDPVRTEAILQRQASAGAVGHVLAQGVARWSRPGTIPPEPTLGMHARLCVPVRWHGEMLGMVLVVDADGTLTPAETDEVAAVADEVAVLLLAGRGDGSAADGDPRDAALDGLLDALLDAAADVRRDAVRAASDLVDPAGSSTVQVLALEVTAGDHDAPHAAAALRHAVGHAARWRDPRVSVRTLRSVGDRSAVVLLATAEPLSRATVTTYAETLLAPIRELSAGRFAAVVGIGGPQEGWSDAWRSGDQARVAARGAGSAVPGPVAWWEDLGAYAVLLRVAGDTGAVPDELVRLRAVDTDGRLEHTVRVLLDSAGDIPVAAEALHVHRTTLYYRLDRVRELAGLDLDDGRVRLALHVGLTMTDLAACDNRRNDVLPGSSGDGGGPAPGAACSPP